MSHKDVLAYLQEYSEQFGLEQYVTYGATVTQLTVLSSKEEDASWPRIRLQWKQQQQTFEQVFDAVCVCNGHYAVPSTPSLPGLQDYFHGTVLHSVQYDDPSVFLDQTVLCIGARASGSDLAREISQHAQHVYLSDSTATVMETRGNVTRTPRTMCVQSNGSIQFAAVQDNDSPTSSSTIQPHVDTIIFCSGYDYSFPFINKQSNLEQFSVIPGERRVMKIYQQLWHPQCLSLAFMGLPHSVVPFPLFELQAEAIVKQLQEPTLPPLSERLQAAQEDASKGGSKLQGRVQETHYLGNAQWDYCREMATLAGKYNQDMENYIATNQVCLDCCE